MKITMQIQGKAIEVDAPDYCAVCKKHIIFTKYHSFFDPKKKTIDHAFCSAECGLKFYEEERSGHKQKNKNDS